MGSGLLLLLCCCLPTALGAQYLTVYKHAPGTVLDPRVIASVRSSSSGPPLSNLRLAVEDAPATPQTRDPGHGRPPFTSSRLRLATGDVSSVRVVLQCIGVGCTFGKGAVLRGINFDGRVEYNGSSLAFNLPAPGHYIATHYYLQVVVHNATGAPHFARGKLFYFWLDRQRSTPSPVRPIGDVTALGIVANSTTPQTVEIQRLLDNGTVPQLYFPGPAVYRVGPLFVQRPMSILLGAGATLQHPPPPMPNHHSDSATGPPTPRSKHVQHVQHAQHRRLGASHCSSPAFLTISADGVHVGGRGGTLDANGFAGHNVCVVDAANVTLRYLLLRGSASWSTHIFRSDHVAVEGIKIFSGADGIDPDNSRDVSLRSVFVHSNDDAIAVKATVAGSNTERIVCERALLSTKKSCVKVGTESLSNFNDVLFSDVEGFDLDRGLVLYPSDGGKFANVMFRRIRLSSFYPYANESRDGAALDFETKHRAGLSQLTNISVVDVVVSKVTGSSLFKGVAGAPIENVAIRNLTLVMGLPHNNKTTGSGSGRPFVFECHGFVDAVTVEDDLHLEWGMYRDAWAGLQNDPKCLRLLHASGH